MFCDRLFQAFGHAGYKEAGATLEFRIKNNSGKGTQFADLIWKPRLLLAMKKGGEKLHLHYRQRSITGSMPYRTVPVMSCSAISTSFGFMTLTNS